MNKTFHENLPEFLEIQRDSFLNILEKGLIEAIDQINPIIDKSLVGCAFTMYPKNYVVISPSLTTEEACLKGKTYGCKIYIPAAFTNEKVNIPSQVEFSTTGVKSAKRTHMMKNKTLSITGGTTLTHLKKITTLNNYQVDQNKYNSFLHSISSASTHILRTYYTRKIFFRKKNHFLFVGEKNSSSGSLSNESKRNQPLNFLTIAPLFKHTNSTVSSLQINTPNKEVFNENKIVLINETNVHDDKTKKTVSTIFLSNWKTILAERWRETLAFNWEKRDKQYVFANFLSNQNKNIILSSQKPLKTLFSYNKSNFIPFNKNKQHFVEINKKLIKFSPSQEFKIEKARNDFIFEKKDILQPSFINNREWVCIGTLPLMTRRGHFIVNGSPRVIINQMTRAPGLYYKKIPKLHAVIVPFRGTWLRMGIDIRKKTGEKLLWVKITKGVKIPYNIFIETFKYLEKEKTYNRQFSYKSKQPPSSKKIKPIKIFSHFARPGKTTSYLRENDKNVIYLKKQSNKPVKSLKKLNLLVGQQPNPYVFWGSSVSSVKLLKQNKKFNPFLLNKIGTKVKISRYRKSSALNIAKAHLYEIYNHVNSQIKVHRHLFICDEICRLLKATILNSSSYDLGSLGRKKLNNRLGLSSKSTLLTSLDLVSLASNLLLLDEIGDSYLYNQTYHDDIDHLENRRVRTCGELLQSEINIGLQRLEMFIKKKMLALTPRGRLSAQNRQRGHKRKNSSTSTTKTSKIVNNSFQKFNNIIEKTEIPFSVLKNTKVDYTSNLLQPAEHLIYTKKQHLKGSNVDPWKVMKSKTSHLLNDFPRKTLFLQSQIPLFKKYKKWNRLAKKKLSTTDVSFPKPSTMVTCAALNNALREFFSSNPLSQYLDQTNPLAEITHKRRLSALGPGGIDRSSAGMAVRGIHPSHYGRICPIETPEGKNAGLVYSMTMFARVNAHGLLETPYYPVLYGSLEKPSILFVTSEQESTERLKIIPGDFKHNKGNFLPSVSLPVRDAGERHFIRSRREHINYCGISPVQNISVATSLIPFLEHDDATRALMGSNMQRQALPLLKPQRALVRTGLEGKVAGESGHTLQAEQSGYISLATGTSISIQTWSEMYETPKQPFRFFKQFYIKK